MKNLMRLACGTVLAVSSVAYGQIKPVGLRCEYRSNPLGIDVVHPRLSWILESEQRGQMQKAYQVLVASSEKTLKKNKGDLWDSGKVKSDQQLHVPYAGKPLESRKQLYWKVRVWSEDGTASDWSEPAMWSMGLLERADWKANPASPKGSATARWIAATDLVEKRQTKPGINIPRLTGYHAKEAKTADEQKWVQVDLGREHSIDTVILYPPTPPAFEHSEGFGFPQRFRIEMSNDPEFKQAQMLADFTKKDYRNPGNRQSAFNANSVKARYVRVTGTRLWKRDSKFFCFALGEIEVLSKDVNVALKASASAKDSIEKYGWGIKRLTDGARIPKRSKRDESSKVRPQRTLAERSGIKAEESNNHPYAAVMLRKEVNLPKKPVRAMAYISGLGYYELSINGKKVGDHVLDPGVTDYTKRVLYVTHDVTKLLKSGRSAISVLLGTGWYDMPSTDVWAFHTAPWIAPPKLLLNINIEYSDGTQETIVSDESWKCSTDGPIIFNSLRGGEIYDARKEMPGWDMPGFDDSAWADAKVAAAPKGRLQAQYHPPIRVVKTIQPVKITEPRPGVYVFDMGVNGAGWARLKTRGERGQKITLQFEEMLNGDGSVQINRNAGLTKGRFQRSDFILKGESGYEIYEPRFTYYGYRYVQVTGLSEKPTKDTLVGYQVHTDPEPAGEFSCSNPLVNRIHKMIVQTQLTNIHGIPTDCPQREKMGWTGDGYITMEEAIYNLRMPTFYLKWWRDMLDVQDDNGHASCIAPSPGWGRSKPDGSPHFLSDPWWGGAIVRLPWKHYRYYGDRRILEEAYEPMKKYLDYVATQAPGHISWANEGDWLEEGASKSKRTPPRLAGTAAYYYHATIVAEIAKLLGKDDEVTKYNQLADEISAAFHKKYFDESNGLYAKDSQTAQAMPLYFGMTAENKRELVVQRFLDSIKNKRKSHVSSGIIGTYYVFQTLMETGHNELAYTMVTQEDYPSWGHMLKHGATTAWESWNGAGSRNHPGLCSIGSWFYQGLGGIRLDPAATAFKRIIIKPTVVGDLEWVNSSYQSLYGKIVSNWRYEDGTFSLNITVPANTTATVYVPITSKTGKDGSTGGAKTVTESGLPAAESKGVRFLRTEDGAAVYSVGSGTYTFKAPHKK